MSLNIFSVGCHFPLFLLLCAVFDLVLQAAVSHSFIDIIVGVLLILNHEAVSDDLWLDCHVLEAWGGSGNMAQRH